MQKNKYFVNAVLYPLPEEIQALLADNVFELPATTMRRDLLQFCRDLSTYYEILYDFNWVSGTDAWKRQATTTLTNLHAAMNFDCLRYIEKVSKYKGGFTTMPVFDKNSNKFMNAETQLTAAIKNLNLLEIVLDEMFENRRGWQELLYIGLMTTSYPEQNFEDLYACEIFIEHIRVITLFKQGLLGNIHDLIEELQEALEELRQ